MHGQPTNQDINLLEDELLQVASLYYSEFGGGAHGHAGLLLSLSAVEYKAMAPGTPIVVPTCLPSWCHSSSTTVAAGSQTQGTYQAISNVRWSDKRPEGTYHESN